MDEIFDNLSPESFDEVLIPLQNVKRNVFNKENRTCKEDNGCAPDNVNIETLDIGFEDGIIIEASKQDEGRSKIERKTARKKTRNPDNWQMNIRKKKRECGEEYKDIKGNIHRRKGIIYGCRTENCKYKCDKNIMPNQRKAIHEGFWKLSDTKKTLFYSKYVKRKLKERKRTSNEESRREYSFVYYLEIDGKIYRVCKNFFLGTLDISSQRIYYFFKHFQIFQMKSSWMELQRKSH